MRILTVCTSTNVFGAEIVTLKMLEALKRAGHTQLAVTSTWTDGRFNRRLASIAVPEVRLPFGSLSKRLALRPMWWTFNVVVRLPWLWIGWRRVIRQFNPDVVIFTTWRHALAVYPFIKRRRSYLIEHTYLEPTPTRHALYRLLARKLMGFIAISDFMRAHAIKIGAPAEKVYLIRNAIFSACDSLRTAEVFASTGEVLRVGIVGQIARHKGHECLIDAVKLLDPKPTEIAVYIFGQGDDRYVSKLRDKLAEFGLARLFHWMGYTDDTASIYSSFDLCVVPSLLGDPFPTVAMETGAYARPVIASRTGGLPEIVEHGVTGWLVEPGNPQDLARCIKDVVQNRERISQMGRAARERIFSRFSQESMVKELEKLFEGPPEDKTQTVQVVSGSGQRHP